VAVSADEALRSYFSSHEAEVDTWFNIISPRDGTLEILQVDLRKLAAKGW
jgi:hypothetical protein